MAATKTIDTALTEALEVGAAIDDHKEALDAIAQHLLPYSDEDLDKGLSRWDGEAIYWDGAKRVRTAVQGPIQGRADVPCAMERARAALSEQSEIR